MPLETFPLLRDNTRLIKHDDTLYKLKVKYEVSSFKNEINFAESEAHSEIEQCFRAVIYMIERKKKPKPILTRHFLVQIQLVPWSFLKRYKDLVFTKDNQVLKVNDELIEFVIRKNIVDSGNVESTASSKPNNPANVCTQHSRSQQETKENKVHVSEKNKNATSNQINADDSKRRKSDRNGEAVKTVYEVENSGTVGSRFYRDKSGRMCRMVHSSTEHLNENSAYPPTTRKVSKQTGNNDSCVAERVASPANVKRHLHAAKNKSDHSKTSDNKLESKNISPKRRHSDRLKVLSFSEKKDIQKAKQSHNTSQAPKEYENRKLKAKSRNEGKGVEYESEFSTSQSSSENSDRKKVRKSRRLETKRKSRLLDSQSETQSDTEDDSERVDFEPAFKKLRLRKSARLSDKESQSSFVHSQDGSSGKNKKAQRRSGRIARSRGEDMSTESEGEMTGNKSNNAPGLDSNDSRKRRKHKLYTKNSSPGFIASGEPSSKPLFSSPRVSTVRPVKRDGVGQGGRRQHTSPQGQDLITSTRMTRHQMQEEETQRMEQLRNPVRSPVPQYRDILHNRRDRHTVEQAEREETTKLRQLYEPTAPRGASRPAPESVRRRSSGLWGKFMESLFTPTKKLFIRK